MRGYLVLESGEVYKGILHGKFERAGEVVFNTSHSGFEEIATDPSYYSQIVVMTAPMMGNYGSQSKVWESNKIYIEGFICLQLQDTEREHSWKSQLAQNQVPILTEVDTRRLTLRLRDKGTPWGAIVSAMDEQDAIAKAKSLIIQKKQIENDWVHSVSRTSIDSYVGKNKSGPKVALYDFGTKTNIVRILQNLCQEVIVVPARTSAEELLKYSPQAVFLSNGPGDPAAAEVSISEVKKLIGKIPLMGVCMGHQILSLALGAETYKLAFGHRGSNHPIRDELLNKVYVSSQNHGYAVKKESLPSNVRVTHTNLNDQSVAGILSTEKKLLGIQYHPEACPGPHDSQELFKYFLKEVVQCI